MQHIKHRHLPTNRAIYSLCCRANIFVSVTKPLPGRRMKMQGWAVPGFKVKSGLMGGRLGGGELRRVESRLSRGGPTRHVTTPAWWSVFN
jgi:hypothetical protein